MMFAWKIPTAVIDLKVKIPSSNRDPLKPQKVSVPIESALMGLRNPFVIPDYKR